MSRSKGLIRLAAVLAASLVLPVNGAIINVDFNGVSNFPGPDPDPLNPVYSGSGPAGGGTGFNAVLVDSRLPGGASGDWQGGDFFLSIEAPNLLDDSGAPTPIGFTVGLVGGDGDAFAVAATNPAALLSDHVFVGYAPHAPDATASFTVSGLGATPFVDLYFYGGLLPVTVPGVNPASFTGTGIFTAENTIFVPRVPVVDGQVTGVFGTGSSVAGFTIVTPEPGPIVLSVAPTGSAVRQDPTVQIVVQDYITEVVPTSVQLLFNGEVVTPVVDRPAGTNLTVISYVPGVLPLGSANTVTFSFSDTATPPVTRTNSFSFTVLSEATAAGTVNIDLNGSRWNDEAVSTFVGQGAAGGGTTFNGITADSMLGDGSNDDALTVGGTALLNSLGDVTAVGFSISPVGGQHTGPATTTAATASLFNDAVFVGGFGQPTGTADFSVTGLSSPAVDLYFYLAPNSAAGAITIPGREPDAFSGNGPFTSANTVFYSHVPVIGGKVTGTLGTANFEFAALSGLTVVTPLAQPYVASMSPTGRGVPTDAVITVGLQDYVTQVVPASIQLFLNGEPVVPTIAPVTGAGLTAVSYAPPGGLQAGSTNTVRIVFGDNATPSVVQANEFTFVAFRTLYGAPLAIGINLRADAAVGGSMQLDGSAGVLPAVYWNNVPGAALDFTGLMDSTGAPTPANLTISSGAIPYQGDNTAPPGGDQEMMTGHIYVGPGGVIDIGVSGLSTAFTGPGYDLFVYYRSGSGSWLQTFAVLDESGATVAGPATVQDSAGIGFDGTYVASDGAGSPGHVYVFTNLNLATFTLEAQPINYAYINGLQIVAHGTGAAAIWGQPQDQSVTVGQQAKFSVRTAGATPLYFQWFRDGTAIPGATDSVYTIPSAGAGDNNAQFSVEVSNSLGTATSRPAVLTVALGALKSALTTANGTRVTVTFAMPVSAATATEASHYAINNGVTVTAAAMINPSAVVLTTSPIAQGTAYTLTVNGVETVAGVPFTPDSQIAVSVSGPALGINVRADAEVAAAMQPEDSAGVIQTPNWNNVPGATTSVSGLVDSTGAVTPIALSIVGDFIPWQAANTAPGAGDNAMMTGHIYVSPGGTIDLVLSGLPAAFTGPGYDLYVYYRSAAGAFPHEYLVLDGSGATVAGPVTASDSYEIGFDGAYVASDGAGSPGHYYAFTGLNLADLTVRTTSPTTYSYFSGLQVVAHGPQPPRITYTREGSTLTLSWTGAATLQVADKITGQWTDLTGQTSPYTTPMTEAARFYRLKQ